MNSYENMAKANNHAEAHSGSSVTTNKEQALKFFKALCPTSLTDSAATGCGKIAEKRPLVASANNLALRSAHATSFKGGNV